MNDLVFVWGPQLTVIGGACGARIKLDLPKPSVFLLLLLFRSHTWQCTGLTLSSKLTDHSWQAWRTSWGAGDETWASILQSKHSTTVLYRSSLKASALTPVISLQSNAESFKKKKLCHQTQNISPLRTTSHAHTSWALLFST